jgi:putative Mn2+ efflux pump MntP
MRKFLEIGGFVAAAILIAFGVVAIVMGVNGRSTVNSSLKQEQIVGSPDMTPTAILAEAQKAGLTKSQIQIPSKSVANVKITNGDLARTFAGYMRIHTFEATHGLTYAQMGRYVAAPGTPAKLTDGQGATSDPAHAVIDPKTKQPVENGMRNLWVTETALTTALNTSFMATQLALFGIVVGFALLLTGIGFLVLSLAGALRNPGSVFARKTSPASPTGKLAPTA